MEERNTISTEELVKMVEDLHSLHFKLEEKFDDQKEHLKCLYERVDRMDSRAEHDSKYYESVVKDNVKDLREYVKDIDFYLSTKFKDFRTFLDLMKKKVFHESDWRL